MIPDRTPLSGPPGAHALVVRALAVALAVASLVATPAAAGEPGWETWDDDAGSARAASPHDALDRILAATVRDERVDYLAIRRDHWDALVDYLDERAEVDPSTLDRDARLAHYINLYNASMIRAVAERFRTDWTPADDDFAVFDEKLVDVAGGTVSLNALEHEIVRPTFLDPRVHAALVCAARSCPPLLPRAYRADDLDATLDAAMRDFLNDRSRNRIDHASNSLELSSLFDWYAEDFGGEDVLAAYVRRVTGEEVATYDVTFLDYSWALNDAKPEWGRWVAIGADDVRATPEPGGDGGVALERGQVFEVIESRDGWLRLALAPGPRTGFVTEAVTRPYRASR